MRTFLISFIAAVGMASSSIAIDLRPSVKEQIEIGQKAAADIRKEEKILPATDPRSIFLKKYGEELVGLIPAAEKKKRPFQYSFEVIDNKEVNAFALPGGPIFFYTGLIDKCINEDQLIGVLGHEITHVRNQHWASQYADTTKRRLGLSVLLAILNANQTIYDVADIVDTAAYLLPYSRKHEAESDKVGYDLIILNKYNPQGMADTFRMLSGGKSQSEFERMLSTHPDPLKRAEAIEKRLKAEKRPVRKMVKLPFHTTAMDPPAAKPPKNMLLSLLESVGTGGITADASVDQQECWCRHHER